MMYKTIDTVSPTPMFASTPTPTLPLKEGGSQHDVQLPSPFRGRVGVQCQQATISLLIGLFISTLTLQVQAEPTANFGRLFSKPAERSNLNVLRQNQKLKNIIAQEAEPQEQIAEPMPIELPAPITLQGYVKRSDGSSTLWINNQAVQENSTIDNVKIGQLNQHGFSQKDARTEGLDLKISANGKHVRLKAGQMYAPESNKIYEMQVVEKAKRLNLEQSGVIDGAITVDPAENKAE